jgi:hypothetical protein
VVRQRRFKKSKALGSDYVENDTSTIRLNTEYAANRDDKKYKTKASSKDLLNFLEETAEDNIVMVKK